MEHRPNSHDSAAGRQAARRPVRRYAVNQLQAMVELAELKSNQSEYDFWSAYLAEVSK